MAIDFACKEFKIEEIIKCGLGLTKADYAVFTFCMAHKEWITTQELADTLSFNLTTVQRAVKKLHDKDVLERLQYNLVEGGYLFKYSIKPKTHIRRVIREIIESWVAKVETELSKL